MNAIENFIEKLKSPHRSFGIKGLDLSTCKAYPYEEYDCEIALLHQCSFRGDRENYQLHQTFKNIFKKDYLELHHPIHNNVLTRAVLDINNPLARNGKSYNHFVFFIDENNKYPWILVNENMFARILITPENLFLAKDLFGVEKFAKWILWLALAEIPKIARNLKVEDLKFVDKKFAINLGNSRPHHFFFDDLSWFYQLNLEKCKVMKTPMFFIGKKVQNLVNEESRVGIRPSLIVGSAKADFLHNELLDLLAANANNGGAEEMVSLTLWIGIPGERRVWLEQWEGIPQILKNLSPYFPSIKVYVDGLTAYDGERIEVESNLEAFYKIVQNTKELFEVEAESRVDEIMDLRSAGEFVSTNAHHDSTPTNPKDSKNSATIIGAKGEKIILKSLSGYDYRTKICYGAMCDVVLSETATTSLVPFYFCKKPGVAFYCAYQADNKVHINMARDFARQIPHLKVPSPLYHTYEGGEREKAGVSFSYHIPYQHFYNLLAESLEELSLEGKLQGYSADNPLKMHRLRVPPVELLAQAYELEKRTGVAFKGNKAEQEILSKIESQKKLLEAQSLVLRLEKQKQEATKPALPTPIPPPKPRGAKERIHHHLAYKLGAALIACSKSFFGYIRMPYVLSHIKAQHQFEQAKYKKAILKKPTLKLPPLESYADYQDALKEKQCYTYKLGAALMEADKTWLGGGYLWFYLESKRLKREFEQKEKTNA